MRFILIVFFLYFIIHINSSSAQSSFLDQILDQHTVAMGGMELWQELKTYTLYQHRPNGSQVMSCAKKPNKFKIISIISDSQRIKSFDGREGFISINGTYQTMRPGEEIEMNEEAEFYEELIFARQNDHQLNYQGIEELDDIICHKVQLIKSPTDTQMYWIRSDNHLIYMTGEYSADPAHSGIYYRTKFFDFKSVEDYPFPFRLQLIASDNRKFELLYDSIKVNQTIDDDFFSYQPSTTADYYEYLKDQHADLKFNNFTFDQETIRFHKDGTVGDTSIWHEYVIYPDKFRIDFGPSQNGNFTIWKNDSVFAFKDHQLVHFAKEYQTALLVKNGHYHYDVDEILYRLDSSEINHRIFSTTNFEGKQVHIIGATDGDLSVPQVWYDAENHYVIRRITHTKSKKILDVIYSNHQRINGAWIEGQVAFYLDNSLIQKERYFNIQVNKNIPRSSFK